MLRTEDRDQSMDSEVVRSPVLMWVAALDLALRKVGKKVDLSKVVALSGDAQQHSSVWWHEFPESLDPSLELSQQLRTRGSFAISLSPIWADAATKRECEEADAQMGGAAVMASKTGSVALERFTGNQIARMARTKPDAYRNTKNVQVLSAALCGLFLVS